MSGNFQFQEDHNIAKTKRQKVDEKETAEEAVLFNSDALSKIISYLPSINILSLALTCKKFGISNDEKLSVIKKSARIIVQDVATNDQLAALPHYNGESSLADYHYLQLLKEPLAFDQLVGRVEYVNSWEFIVRQSGYNWGTAYSNNILRAGKHYVSFEACSSTPSRYTSLFSGVMRPGRANESARGYIPLHKEFFQQFSRRLGQGEHNNNVHCCMYYSYDGECYSSDWEEEHSMGQSWEGMESTTSNCEIGMLLDLDEGTLTVYMNGQKLGVMKRGLVGPYCWVVSMLRGTNVAIKRGTIPPS